MNKEPRHRDRRCRRHDINEARFRFMATQQQHSAAAPMCYWGSLWVNVNFALFADFVSCGFGWLRIGWYLACLWTIASRAPGASTFYGMRHVILDVPAAALPCAKHLHPPQTRMHFLKSTFCTLCAMACGLVVMVCLPLAPVADDRIVVAKDYERALTWDELGRQLRNRWSVLRILQRAARRQ